MEFVEVVFELSPDHHLADRFIAELFEAGADGVWEDAPCIKGYIPTTIFSKEFVDDLLAVSADFETVKWRAEALADVNWNKKWEENYPIAFISPECRIVGPFHDSDPEIEFELLVAPKMAFGTGHHSTTAMVIQAILSHRKDFDGASVADVGCGTGVLGILASKLGAATVLGIDYDKWSVENTAENIGLNSVNNMTVELGDSSLLSGRSFQVILANINRNILLDQLPDYAASCVAGGRLILSGFMEADIDKLHHMATSVGFVNQVVLQNKEWRALIYERA